MAFSLKFKPQAPGGGHWLSIPTMYSFRHLQNEVPVNKIRRIMRAQAALKDTEDPFRAVVVMVAEPLPTLLMR